MFTSVIRKTLTMCRLCGVAYLEKNEIQTAFDNDELSMFTSAPVYVENDRAYNDGQAFVGHVSENDACVVFRGTDSMRDWLTDLNIARVRMDIPGVEGDDRPLVHAGFIRQYRTLDTAIMEELRTFQELKNVYVAGHSLGGALATIASIQIKAEFPEANVECYTFGSPRVGNQHLADLYSESVGVSQRYMSCRDPVTTTPFPLRYRHVCGARVIYEDAIEDELRLSHLTRFFNIIGFWFSSLLGYNDSPVRFHSVTKYQEDIENLLSRD